MTIVLTVETEANQSATSSVSNRVFRWIEEGQELIVGRSGQQADLVLANDHRMSSRHFTLGCQSGVHLVKDLESTNGTLLNGHRISEATLGDNDTILAGETSFHIHIPSVGGVNVSEDQSHVLVDDWEATYIAETEQDTQAETSTSQILDGWDLELTEWPSPLAAEVQQSVFEQSGQRDDDQSAVQANVVLMIHDESPTAEHPNLSRAVAWIGGGQRLVVGRSAQQCDWAITADHYLSGQHFRLTNESGKCQLDNVSKTNGTWVNGYKVDSALLRDKDLIRAGQTVFQVGISDGVPLSDLEVRTAMVLSMGERDF